MANLDGNIIIAVIALIINLITIIKFTNSLENRLTRLETIIEKAIQPNISKLEKVSQSILARSHQSRKHDGETFDKK